MNATVREILAALPSRAPRAAVFPSASGATPRNACTFMNRVFRKALAAATIENFRWHNPRHTFASRLVMKGVDLRTVQELLGHKTITMTLRYSHLSPAHQFEAVQRLDAPPTGTTTGTRPRAVKPPRTGRAQVIELRPKISAPGVIRTPDLLVRSPNWPFFAE